MPKRPSFYVLLAGFILGGFAGAAFGAFYALSLAPGQFLPSFSDMNRPAAPAAAPAASSQDAEVIAAVKSVSPSVVSISIIKDVSRMYDQTGPFSFDFFGFPSPQQPAAGQGKDAPAPQKQQVGGGSGFVISADGLILTNRHVVEDQQADYEVVMQDGTKYPAKVLARDQVLDLAVLKIEAKGLVPADLGSSDGLQIGQTVIAIGNALSEYQNTVTKGVVSGINRRVVAGGDSGFSEVIEEAIQTDAAINPGNSGGPLIDLKGRVVGVNTAVNQAGQSIGFAIPIDAAKIVIDSVRAAGRIVRPWLGVRYVMLTPDLAKTKKLSVTDGALVSRGSQGGEPAVAPGSPAEKAGLQENDVLLEVDGQPIDADHTLSDVIGRKKPGETVTIVLQRGSDRKTVMVTLGELPETVK